MDIDREYLNERLGELEKRISVEIKAMAGSRPTYRELIVAVVAAITLACTIMAVIINLVK